MKLSIFTTATNPIERQDPYEEALACYNDLADEVIVLGDDWPQEFSWEYIGQTFDKGYQACSGDWVIRMDLDYFFHEDDMSKLLWVLNKNYYRPAISFWKYQFIKADRASIKSRLAIAFNKREYGSRIRLDSGGDLCQPSLDGKQLSTEFMREARIPVYNYDFTFKTEEVVAKDFARFARAWSRRFGEDKWGDGTEETAIAKFKEMMLGRYLNRANTIIPIDEHPKYIKDKLHKLTPEQFGYNLWGMIND